MPRLENINLQIGPLKPDQGVRTVDLKFDVLFSESEIQAGAAFTERIKLMGADLNADDEIFAFSPDVVRATGRRVTRMVSGDFASEDLDEDRDVQFFGKPVLILPDEIYAHVDLSPFTAEGVSGNSNTVEGSFGPPP